MPKDEKSKPLSKSQLKSKVAEKMGLEAKQVDSLFEVLKEIVTHELNTVGAFTLPDLVKFSKVVKAATPEKQTVNPFTKAPMTVKAKPAHNVVKARLLKPLKESVS